MQGIKKGAKVNIRCKNGNCYKNAQIEDIYIMFANENWNKEPIFKSSVFHIEIMLEEIINKNENTDLNYGLILLPISEVEEIEVLSFK